MKKFILVFILSLAITVTIFAQQLSLGDIRDSSWPENLIGWESPTSVATNGLFTSDADDFIDPSFFSDMEFDKFYAMTSFKDFRRIDAGLAFRIKDLYLGAYYGGKFIADKIDFPYSEKKYNWLGKDKNGVRVYEFADEDDFLGSYHNSDLDNEASILIGIANMGFRLSFASTYQSFSDTDFVYIVDPDGPNEETSYVKNAQFGYGDLIPQIKWGMAKDLIDKGIRPYASFQLGIHREYGKRQLYNDGTPDYNPKEEEILTSVNYFAPVFTVGLGGFTFFTKGEFNLSADFDYGLTIISPGNNEYNYTDNTDNGKIKIKTFKGINYTYVDKNDVTHPNQLSEISINSHTIAPSLYGSWEDGNLSFMLRLGFDFEVTNYKFTGRSEHSNYNDGTLAKDGADGSTTEFTFLPSLGLAAQWQIVPKLALNIGGYLAPGTVTRTKTESLYYNQDTPSTTGSVTTVSTSFEGAKSLLTLGAILNATKNFAFEAVTGAGYSSKEKNPDDNPKDKNSISVFGKDDESYGLFYFFQLLVSVKF